MPDNQTSQFLEANNTSVKDGLGQEVINELVAINQKALEEFEKDPQLEHAYQVWAQAQNTNVNLVNDLLGMMYPSSGVSDIQSRDEFGYIEWNNSAYNYDTLRRMGKLPPARIIKNHRRMQLIEYGKIAGPTGKGFRLKYTDRIPTEYERRELELIEQKICDKFFYPAYATKPSMVKWLGQVYEEWFDIDDITLEIPRGISGFPRGIHVRDSKYYKPVVPHYGEMPIGDWDVVEDHVYNKLIRGSLTKTIFSNKNKLDENGDPISCLVIDDRNQLVGKFSEFNIRKLHFYETTELARARRGYSVMAQAASVLKSIMGALQYNAGTISNNHMPMGAIALTGGQASLLQVEKFKKLMYLYVSGPQNRKHIPVIGLPEHGDIKFVNMQNNSQEVEYHLWMVLLFTILCRISGTNPEEVSMSSHEAVMTGKKLFDQDASGIRQISQDLGLKMFLYWIAEEINKSEIWSYIFKHSNVICEFVGLEAEVKKERLEIDQTRLQLDTSMNEIRKEKGKEPRLFEIGGENIFDIPGIENNSIYQLFLQKMKNEQEIKAAEQQNQNPPGAQGDENPDEELEKKYSAEKVEQ